MRNLSKLLVYLRTGGLRLVAGIIVRRLYSDDMHIGLRRDTDSPFPTARPNISLQIRPIEDSDWGFLRAEAGHRDEDARDLMSAMYLFRSGVQTCYVARTKEGEPSFIQYVIGATENGKLEEAYGDLIPPLAADEAFLEGAYSPLKYRGRGVMLHVLPRLADEARARGVRRLIAYPSVGDRPMLRACKWSGFIPFVVRRESYRLFRRRVTFVALPEGAPYPFESDGSQVYDVLR
jgi:hypothetical protein